MQIHLHLNKQIPSYFNNRVNYEIDHIFPISLFDCTVTENQYKCCHFTNLQPLTRDENRLKSNKLPTKAMASKVDPSCWPDGYTMDMLPDIYPGWATPLRMYTDEEEDKQEVGLSSSAGSSEDHARMEYDEEDEDEEECDSQDYESQDENETGKSDDDDYTGCGFN